MTTRLDKTINGLKQIVDRYSKHDLLEFSTHQVVIKPKAGKALWLWFYIIFLVLAPIGIFVYLLIQNKTENDLTMVLSISLATYFGVLFIDLLKGQQTLTIDLVKKQFIFNSLHKSLLRLKGTVNINFSQVQSVTVKKKALKYNNSWNRLKLNDANGATIGYIDLGSDFSDKLVADKIKIFLDVVLWTFNEKK